MMGNENSIDHATLVGSKHATGLRLLHHRTNDKALEERSNGACPRCYQTSCGNLYLNP
jgi:hypothetical protein